MWRHKDWDKIRPHSTTDPDDPELKRDRVLAYNYGFDEGVEAGADAMLEALMKDGVNIDEYMNPKNMTLGQLYDWLYNCVDGWVLFIPGEEK